MDFWKIAYLYREIQLTTYTIIQTGSLKQSLIQTNKWKNKIFFYIIIHFFLFKFKLK